MPRWDAPCIPILQNRALTASNQNVPEKDGDQVATKRQASVSRQALSVSETREWWRDRLPRKGLEHGSGSRHSWRLYWMCCKCLSLRTGLIHRLNTASEELCAWYRSRRKRRLLRAPWVRSLARIPPRPKPVTSPVSLKYWKERAWTSPPQVFL